MTQYANSFVVDGGMLMTPEVDAAYFSPRSSVTARAAAMRLRLSMQGGPICLIPRTVPRSVAAILDTATSNVIPTFDAMGSPGSVRSTVSTAFQTADSLGSAAAWLRDDVVSLVDLYAEAFDASWLHVRLLSLYSGRQSSFRVDPSAFRMMTTYIGSGPEWISPRWIAAAPDKQPFDPGAVRHVDRGTIVVLRGGRSHALGRPAILFRMPSSLKTGELGLLLSITEGEQSNSQVADSIML